MSALERLRADAEGVAQVLSTGRAALPRLAMGTDSEGLVHVGMDQRGDVVRLDLDPHWRDTLPAGGLGAAVSEALQQAAQVRTGDWAAAIAATFPGPRSSERSTALPRVAPTVRHTDGPITVGRDAHGPVVTLDQRWTADADDDAVRSGLLAALTLAPHHAATMPSARPAEVRGLAQRTRDSLLDCADALPAFMRGPIHDSVERVHDGVAQALALPVASEGVASGELGAYAARLHACLWLVDRPAGLPEASDSWATAASGLTAGLANARRAPRSMLSRLRRRASA